MQGRDDGLRPCNRTLVEAQVVLARPTDAGTLEDRGLAMRAGAGRTGRARTRRAHAAPNSALPLPDLAAPLSLLPNSTWPFMREPAATVRVSALRSPVIT